MDDGTYCSACGRRSPDGASFCANCGAPLVPPRGTGRPPDRRRQGLWIALAAVVAVLIVIAVAIPIVRAARGDGEQVAESTTTSSTAPPSTTTEPPDTSTTTTEEATSTTSTTAAPIPGIPGDSSGEWVAVEVPDVMAPAVAVALSDDVMAVKVDTEGGADLRARLFATGETFELPVGDGDIGGIDVDGRTVVWWEGSYDEATFSYVDQHIYTYRLPDGPKIDIVGGDTNVGYPQIAGPWLTWVEGSPWEEAPEEYWRMPVFGSLLDSRGGPVGEPTSLVPSAIASIIGDAVWTYSLSESFLAWEQMAEADGVAVGMYVLDLATNETLTVGSQAWRPSLSGDTLVYWGEDDGLIALDLVSGERRQIDARGDFATAAPTFAAYFRPAEAAGGGYEIVARGYGGVYEQVLAEETSAPPWLSAPVAVAGERVAFVADEGLRLFEWQAR